MLFPVNEGAAMKRSSLVLPLGLLALTAGAALGDTPPQAVQTNDPQAAARQPLYKSIWRQDAQNNIVHLQSGLVCDAQIGDYRRNLVYAFKPSGFDVSCNYLDPGHGDVTIYLTRRFAQSLDDDFAEAKHELMADHPDATETAVATPPAAAGTTFKTEFYARQAAGLREGVWIGDLDGWTLEYRGTWIPADEASIFTMVSTLTAKALASAGAQLGLCAKLPAPVRDGVLVTGKDDIQNSLVSQTIIAAAAEGAVQDAHGTATEPAWCAETVIGDGNDALLLWHGVNADGGDAQVDKVTPFTTGEPGAVVSSVNSSLDQILSEAANAPKTKQRWTISFTDDRGTWTMAFYDGRPTAEALARIAHDLRDNKARPLGGYSTKDKKITITMPEQK
jgi:hypothetical protein